MSRKRFIFLAALITLLAAVLRLAALGEIPPGLHYDEAANVILTRGIAFRGEHPLFITAYTGKETLWFYLGALVMRVAGPSPFSARLTSALVGTLTVAATGWAVRRLYDDDPRRDALALLSMGVLAVAFWHGVLSRLAFRAITQPLMQAISLGLLWGGLSAPPGRRRRITLLVAGLATGLTAYTYLAARLFPIPLAVGLIVWLGAERVRLNRLLDLAIYGLSAVIAVGPLGLFFLRHPELFTTRIGQVAPASWMEALDGWRLALRMFFLSGDPLWRFNLPLKPLFGPALAVCFLTGLGIAAVDLLKAERAPDQARGALLIVWPLAMLAPTALATGSVTPSNLRAIGLAPLIALYPALGIAAMAKWLAGERTAWRARLIGAALAAILVGGGALTWRDTQRWGGEPTLYYDNDGHLAALAEFLNQQPDDTTRYVAAYHYRHPTLAALSDGFTSIHSLFGGKALVLAPEGDTLAVYARDAFPPDDWQSWLESYLIASPPGPDGSPDFLAYRLPEDFAFDVPPVEPANFANLIRLEGASLHPAESGGEAEIDLAWRVLAPAEQADYALIAEVWDEWGFRWLKTNLDGTLEPGHTTTYPSEEWTPGERMLIRMRVPLPQGMPPGEYTVRVSIFSASANERLPLLDEAGGFAGQYAEVRPLTITRSTQPDLSAIPIQHWLDQPVNDSIWLIGYDYPQTTVRQGEPIQLSLYWLSEAAPEADEPVRLTLDNGTILYQGNPMQDTYPFSEWEGGELVMDRYAPRLPLDLPGGDYDLLLQVGEGDPLVLGRLTVEALSRQFTLPDRLTPLDPPVTLGGQIALVGYDLPERAAPGETLTTTLAWRAEEIIERGYTVFVHLVDENGTILAQQDRAPQADGAPYPTNLWMPGEIITDDYTLTIPLDAAPGTYTVQVGLYLAESGQRLSVPGSADNAVVLPAPVVIR
jgi:hypothetical protein